MHYKHIVISLLFGLFAFGCASNPEKYMSMPAPKLCMDYMTYPSYNIHQESRAMAIAQRQIDCRPYIGMAEQRRQANENFEEALRNLSNIQ